MSLNKVMLIGNVGADPEVRYLEQNAQNQSRVASFRLATTERFRDRNNELRENTEWHSVVVWGRNAEIVEKYVKKGTTLYVEGSLRSRSFDGRDGQKHYVTEVRADNIQLLSRRQDGPAGADNPQQDTGYPQQGTMNPQPQPQPQQGRVNPQPQAQPQINQKGPEPMPVEGPDDDLPF